MIRNFVDAAGVGVALLMVIIYGAGISESGALVLLGGTLLLAGRIARRRPAEPVDASLIQTRQATVASVPAVAGKSA